jgi:hypothetical protein
LKVRNIDFVITGYRETGDYIIEELVNGALVGVHKVIGNKNAGLKESRKWIGEYVISKYGFPKGKLISHKCVKPGREEHKNPVHYWDISRYL